MQKTKRKDYPCCLRSTEPIFPPTCLLDLHRASAPFHRQCKTRFGRCHCEPSDCDHGSSSFSVSHGLLDPFPLDDPDLVSCYQPTTGRWDPSSRRDGFQHRRLARGRWSLAADSSSQTRFPMGQVSAVRSNQVCHRRQFLGATFRSRLFCSRSDAEAMQSFRCQV